MFSGLVQTAGRIQNTQKARDSFSRILTVFSDDPEPFTLGESVSVNGVCLTVIQCTGPTFQVECSPTTLAITTLGTLTPDDPINLERAVTPSTRLGGHWVQGHIDTQGHVDQIEPEGETRHVMITFLPHYRPLLVPFGSVTVDGVSLTIVNVESDRFRVTLIPYTQTHTTLGALHLQQAVNLEFDVLGKYVQQLCAPYLGSERKVPNDDE